MLSSSCISIVWFKKHFPKSRANSYFSHLCFQYFYRCNLEGTYSGRIFDEIRSAGPLRYAFRKATIVDSDLGLPDQIREHRIVRELIVRDIEAAEQRLRLTVARRVQCGLGKVHVWHQADGVVGRTVARHWLAQHTMRMKRNPLQLLRAVAAAVLEDRNRLPRTGTHHPRDNHNRIVSDNAQLTSNALIPFKTSDDIPPNITKTFLFHLPKAVVMARKCIITVIRNFGCNWLADRPRNAEKRKRPALKSNLTTLSHIFYHPLSTTRISSDSSVLLSHINLHTSNENRSSVARFQ